MSRQFTRGSLLLTLVIAFATPALAGPPLLCHPFDIGSARSLPWIGPGWSQAESNYDVNRLTSDTAALLTPSTPVVVRMETLRRAALYASRDRAVAARLLTTLTERTRAFDPATKRPDALAWLDAAYFTEALRQIGHLGSSQEFRDRAPEMASLVKNTDGRAMIEKAVLLRPDDPGVEFAAALINADTDRGVYLEHARRARASADRDMLVARNIAMVQ
jgi:hypothetical protein